MPPEPVIEPHQREGDADLPEDEEQILEGPDPRQWPADTAIWNLVEDIEVLDKVIGLLSGPLAAGPITMECRNMLAQSATQQREVLSGLLLALYGTKLPETAKSPYAHAGRPRAFGADPPPPPGNT